MDKDQEVALTLAETVISLLHRLEKSNLTDCIEYVQGAMALRKYMEARSLELEQQYKEARLLELEQKTD